MKIDVCLGYDCIEVRFDGFRHLRVSRSKLLGIQSWRNGPKYFCIEFTLEGGVVLCEYDSEEKWKSILDGLDKLL